MYAVLAAAVRYLLGLLFSASAIKWLAVGAIFFLLEAVVDLVLGLLDQNAGGDVGSLVNQIPADMLFYLHLFKIDVGLTLVLAAYATRFAIRRIPIIG